MTKQPSHSGERPLVDSTPDSGDKPFDPSHFGKHEFPLGLREELIKAEKPRIDPKFLQDTVPPNRKPVLTEPERPAMTPRGGFAAPKPQPTVDRDAPTLIAAPVANPREAPTPDAVTLVKLPTAKVKVPATKPADWPSAPPVDTSRTDSTIVLPSIRKKKDNRGLVIGIVASLVVLLVIGLLLPRAGETESVSATPIPKLPVTTEAIGVPQPNTPVVAPEVEPQVDTSEPTAAASAAPSHASATDPTSTKKKAGSSSKPQSNTKPAPTAPKSQQGFDPSKPWEED